MENNKLIKQLKKIIKITTIPLLLSVILFAIGTYTANKNLSYLGAIFLLVTAGIFSVIQGYYAIFKKLNPISTAFFPLFGFDNLPNAVIIILGILFMLMGCLMTGFSILALIKLILLWI